MAAADNTPVIIAVSVILGVLLIALLVFLFVFCSRRMKRATNVRRRFIPGDDEERAIVRRAEPMSREIIREPMPLSLPMLPAPRLLPALPEPIPSPSRVNNFHELRDVRRPSSYDYEYDDAVMHRGASLDRPQHRVVTHEVIHHHHDPTPLPPTPPPQRELPEREPRKDWVLVRRVKKRRKRDRGNRDESRSHSSSSSSDEEVEEEARMYGQFPRQPQVPFPQPQMGNPHPWQMMFYQAQNARAMPYQHNIGALDLAGMTRPPAAPMPGLAQAPTAYEVSIPKRPNRAYDDSAIPDNRDEASYNWGTARVRVGGGGEGAVARSSGATRSPKEYETRERVATYFEAEF